MTQQLIGIGTVANDGTGDTWRDAMDKVNDNFTELFDIGTPDNQVIVNEIADFPAAVGGIITLAASTFYLVGASINMGDLRFIFSDDTVVAGLDSSASMLTYLGTGDMFTGTDTANKVTKITLDAPSGRVFNLTSPANTGVFQINDVTVDNCNEIGVVNNLLAVQDSNTAYNNVISDGWSFIGTLAVFTSGTDLVNMAAGSFIDLGTATFNAFDMNSTFITLAAGADMLTGAAASANITTGNIGSVKSSRIFGAGASTPLSGIDQDDIRWLFEGNDEITDTNADGLLSLNGNATETVITVATTPVLVNATWVVERNSLFTGTTGGRLTYNGERDLAVPIDIVATVISASGVNKDISIYLALNGTPVTNSAKTNRVGVTDPKNTSVPWQLTLSESDFLEAYIANDTDTINLIVQDAVLRAR